MIFNGFEFSSRLNELFAFCNDLEALDYVLILLKELKMKSQSYFADLKLAEAINEWFASLEQFQEKEIFSRTFINLQYNILNWLESVIIFAETNAKIYYDLYGRDGSAQASYNLIYDIVNKIAPFSVYRVLLFMSSHIHPQYIDIPYPFVGRFLSQDEALQFSSDSENDMDKQFVMNALENGEECFGVFPI